MLLKIFAKIVSTIFIPLLYIYLFSYLHNYIFILVKKHTKWIEYEQHIVTYFSACVYTAGLKKANDENCDLQEKEIRYIQTEGLLQHLCGNHELCWSEVCWIKQNPEIQLREPTGPLNMNIFYIVNSV